MKKKNTGMSLKLFISFFCLMFLIISYGQIMITLDTYGEKLLGENIVNNYIRIDGDLISYDARIDSIKYSKDVNLMEKGNYRCTLPTVHLSEILLPPKTVFYFDMLKYEDNKSFSEACEIEFERKFNEDLMLYGTKINGDDQIIISDKTAQYLSYESGKTKEDLIGESFSISSGYVRTHDDITHENIDLYNGLEIVGIYNESLTGLVNNRNVISNSVYNYMIVSSNVTMFMPEIYIEVDLSLYEGQKTINAYSEIYPENDITYMGEEAYNNLELVNNIKIFITRVLLLVGIMIFMALAINFFVVIDNDFRKKKRLYGLMSVLGIKKTKIITKIVTNISIVFFIATFLAALISIILIRQIVISISFNDMEQNIGFIIGMTFILSIICLAIIIAFTVIILNKKLNKDTIELLK